MKYFVGILLIYLIVSSSACSCKENHALEQALALAGENRSELEKVLNRYAADPAYLQRCICKKFILPLMHAKQSNAVTIKFLRDCFMDLKPSPSNMLYISDLMF